MTIRYTLSRLRAVGIAAIVASLLLVAIPRVALAHAGFFTIWGYGLDIWSGQVNHYDSGPQCGYQCPYDYMIPTNAEVHQSVAGDFIWVYLDLPAGNVFAGGDAFKGTMYLIGYSGQIATSGAFFCTSIRQSGGYFLDAIDNGGPTGYWEQDSGGGWPDCYGAYGPVPDKQAVQAQ